MQLHLLPVGVKWKNIMENGMEQEKNTQNLHLSLSLLPFLACTYLKNA